MNRTFFALLTAVALLSNTGCAVGDRLFGCNRSDSSCNSSSCGNGACGNSACGNGACNGSGCNNGACGHCDGNGMVEGNSAAGPNDPSAGDPSANGAYANGGGPNGYGHGPLPRGVGGQYVGPQGPPTGGVAYPYYTNRGPRDFLDPNPPSIGP